MPFRPGEELVFVLKWVNIPAGKAVLRVEPLTDINGIKARHFVMTAKTNKFVDFFYKVRDRIDAYADIKMNHSVLFKRKQKEGSYKKHSRAKNHQKTCYIREKNVIGVINVISRQNLKVNGKIYDTFLVEPELKNVGGVFKKSKKAKMQLWITADSKRIPVKIKSKVAVGTFFGELVSSKGLVP